MTCINMLSKHSLFILIFLHDNELVLINLFLKKSDNTMTQHDKSVYKLYRVLHDCFNMSTTTTVYKIKNNSLTNNLSMLF